MTALEILNGFIESGSAPDVILRQRTSAGDPVICFAWVCGTRLNLSYDGEVYDRVWDRFEEYRNLKKVAISAAMGM